MIPKDKKPKGVDIRTPELKAWHDEIIESYNNRKRRDEMENKEKKDNKELIAFAIGMAIGMFIIIFGMWMRIVI